MDAVKTLERLWALRARWMEEIECGNTELTQKDLRLLDRDIGILERKVGDLKDYVRQVRIVYRV